ncbi:chemotaxis protein CheC [Candidatus Desulforudis audaxviator]|uniref:CheC, inhibitor of MCP methylation n=1 Tax=Desulforudis audaxviator (strain MP104C) TaxID=477974 RepID=B1I5I8_DESAP|nr:chemotaxis protein CheC [Candidatus Desulforudis audaxviator]ACA60235.1 CheC, inhibitor of MCP methylation [Candidatus Desulforudis audaxviator MP104C]AZK60284.1 Chemotaxis protein CheC -- inhibitor of MCP methylation [Candidatus Desulforudis audaxviator]
MKFSNSEIDVLREIGNIGVGNAATALASLLQAKVSIKLPRVAFLELEEAIESIGGLEQPVVCVNLQVGGDISATLLFIFDQESACALVELLLDREKGTVTALDEMGRSVVMEIGNILTGSFTGAIATMTGLRLVPSVPVLAHDMLGALFTDSVASSGYLDERVLCIQTSFLGAFNQDQVDSHMILLPDIDSLDHLFEALGVAAAG